MADLYYVDFSSMDVEELIKKYEDIVDRQRLSKITRTRAKEARVRSLLGGYLLQVALRNYLGITDDNKIIEPTYVYGPQGKPYLADYPEFFFSLSHSGSLVALIASGQEVGMDVQQHVQIKEGLAKRFFTAGENILLNRQKDNAEYQKMFFRLWSIKESYMKLTGLGMKLGLDSFEIDFYKREINQQKRKAAVFQEISLPGMGDYSVSICLKEREEVRICTQKLI